MTDVPRELKHGLRTTDEQMMAPHEPGSGTTAIPAELAAVTPVDGPLVPSGASAGSVVASAPHVGSGSLDQASGRPLPPPAATPPPSSVAPRNAPLGLVDDHQQLVLLDALPVAAILVDELGNVSYLNERASGLIGLPRAELLGRSVLDFVGVDHLDFVVDMMNGGGRYEDEVMGPSRVQYVDAAGEEHWTQVWARNAPEEVCPGGFIVTLTSESVRDVISVTATTVGVDSTLEWTLDGIAKAARGLPLDAKGVVLTVEGTAPVDDREFRLIGEWPIDHRFINDPGMPWREALDTATVCDVPDVATSDLPGAVRTAFDEAGIGAVLVRPIGSLDGGAHAVYVIFRRRPGPASPNMDDHIADAIRLAQFSFTLARRQIELKRASYQDALTGLSNRAAFNDRVRSERRATDVLFVDLDHFKEVNDTYGHEVGDRVLVMAAERIETTLRSGARAFRTGGDEFIVLCESTGDDPAERIALAERIVDVLMTPFDIDIHRVRIGATVGIAASGTRSLVDTVRAADTALYRAKRRGRSGWAHEGH